MNRMPNPQLTQPPAPAAEEIFSRAEIRQLATLYSERAETDTQIKDLEADKEKLNVSIRKILDKHDPAQVRSFRLGNFSTSYYKTVRFNQKQFITELLYRKVSSKVIKEAQEASNVESENFTLMVKALKNGDAGE